MDINSTGKPTDGLTGGAGTPDGWDRLWAPHRMSYLSGENRPMPGNDIPCPFCRIQSLSDEEGLIVARGTTAYVVMNLYPYNAGHLLICANRHVADLTDLSEIERNEILELTAHGMKVLREISGAKGFNIGMNQGAISGAGIAEHIHQHVVPPLERRCKLYVGDWKDESFTSTLTRYAKTFSR